MYFIVDLMSEYKEFVEFDDLKNLLVDLSIRDIMFNTNDSEIVSCNLRTLEKMAKDDSVSLRYIEDKLSSFSYKVIDILQIQRDLEDLKQFIGEECLFNSVINLINNKGKGEKQNG